MDVTIVIPAYNAAAHLSEVLDAIVEADVVVVDPGSTDETAEVARRHGARVIRLPERAGPAEARNRGVEQVETPVVLFIDSDCVPHADVVARVREAFESDPELVSLTGSYDSSPRDSGFFSRYMNLRHHHTHQVAQREDATFWAGCGAVRRAAFVAVGGFDAERYPAPQIEDIELGLRLAECGATRLDPDLQVKHLKRWTLRSVVLTDVLQRAVPWSRLLLERGGMPNDLNLRWSQRLAAALSPPVLLSVLVVPIAAASRSWLALAPALAILVLSAVLNRGLATSFARLGGWAFAVGGWLFHQVHLLYSSATYAVCWLLHRLRR